MCDKSGGQRVHCRDINSLANDDSIRRNFHFKVSDFLRIRPQLSEAHQSYDKTATYLGVFSFHSNDSLKFEITTNVRIWQSDNLILAEVLVIAVDIICMCVFVV